ncbi:mycofactocin-coupled SDR family oxidoreductase [[Mycobacterium] wendilense]|uniref:Mycofactocin-coupled SDR family oxidoreductase n=1 Tax=[Mycobacterium] wendilense TaxID=3064284 RepID=A0ABM9MIU2_9MYCO|nr:mycofactocin-coupled SDR family oxidoreductase [Mycolicibacterium sp. MU0050]CAJ1586052.1 mycofactocin-coupled SDR family oxidoreductase [Mycolicibacterium sp. MU0050]
MGKLDGKVAFITGAARGQGRSHAVALATEGADIIAVDLCEDIATNEYPLSTWADLEETRRLVEKEGRRIHIAKADVRNLAALEAALGGGIETLGRLDVVVANAGICPMGPAYTGQAFIDAVSVDLTGVINTVATAYPHLTSGASIIATGSVAGLIKGAADNPATGPGGAGYAHAKRGVATFVHDLAAALAPESIRVNAVHPTNCSTDMLFSTPMYRVFRPDLDAPGREDAEAAFPAMQPMPTGWVEPADVSSAVVFLASDDSRYITGLQLKIDAGATLSGTVPFAFS